MVFPGLWRCFGYLSVREFRSNAKHRKFCRNTKTPRSLDFWGAHASSRAYFRRPAGTFFGEHSEPRCGNVPLTRTPKNTRGTRRRESRFAATRSRDILSSSVVLAGGYFPRLKLLGRYPSGESHAMPSTHRGHTR